MARINRGRQKIEIKKMTNLSNLHVTFSKRRFGVFKKASELCTLCGVDAAVLVFSPGNKLFSFGHKSVELVIQRFLNEATPSSSASPTELVPTYRDTIIHGLNAQLMQVHGQLDMEKKKGQELTEMKKASQAECWWQKSASEIKKEHLGQLKLALEELYKNATEQSETISFQNLKDATQFFVPNFGTAHVMLPPTGISGLNDFAVADLSNTNTNANADAFGFNPNVMPPPPPAMPPTYDYGFGNSGFY